MTQGERVKGIRKYKELTLEKFGDTLGVTKQTVSRIENGVNNLTEQMIKSICREFSVNEDWLRTGEGEMFVTKTRKQEITDFLGDMINEPESFKSRFIEAMAKLGEKDWEDIERITAKIVMDKEKAEGKGDPQPKQN